MKKQFSILALILLFCAVFTVGVAGANEGKISLSGGSATLKRGESLELTVELNRNPGVKTLRCTVNYDRNVLEFVSAEGTKALSGFKCENSDNNLLLRWTADKDQTGAGKVAKLSFLVKKDAIYGDSSVSLSISDAMYDAQNSRGDAVHFDITGFKFTLSCPHENAKSSVEKEATFEEEGLRKETCPECGNTTMYPLLPTVKSADERVIATVSAGEFSNDDIVEVRAENLYGKEEGKAALDTLGEDMFYCFRIRFTKNGEKYVPTKECTVKLKSDSDLSAGLVLYAMVEGGALQPKFQRNKNTVEFVYNDVVFALVARAEDAEPEVSPTVTTVKPKNTEAPATTTTENLFEKERRQEITLIVAGVVTLVLCGVGMVLILGKRNRF